MNESPSSLPPAALQSQIVPPPQRISVVDFDMPFNRMVVFMIKWAFAAIPALIVIWTVVFLFLLIIAVFFGGVAALSGHR